MVSVSRQVRVSQILAAPSPPAVASSEPSWLKSTPLTPPGPVNRVTGSPEGTLQIAAPSPPDVASNVPSGLNASPLARPLASPE